MKVISDRTSILKKENLLSVVILPSRDKVKFFLLFLWLLTWTVCGIIVFASYFNVNDKDARLFIIVYLAFWSYFEFSILRSFIWKKWGKEKLWIADGMLHYQREINGKGKIYQYTLDLVDPLRMIVNESKFAEVINQSFWVKGGERLEFSVLSKIHRLGMQITETEARQILSEVNRFIKHNS